MSEEFKEIEEEVLSLLERMKTELEIKIRMALHTWPFVNTTQDTAFLEEINDTIRKIIEERFR